MLIARVRKTSSQSRQPLAASAGGFLLAVLLVVFFLAAVAGCAATAEGKRYQVETGYNATVQSLIAARQDRLIDDATWHTINQAIQSGRLALIAWHAANVSGDTNAAGSAVEAFNRASAALNATLAALPSSRLLSPKPPG